MNLAGNTNRQSNVITTMNFVLLIIIASKILGFVKQIVVSAVYGTSFETDIITLSQGFISTIQYIFAQLIIIAFVSIYIHIAQKNKQQLNRFTLDSFKVFLFFGSLITIIILVLAPNISLIIAPSYSSDLSNSLAKYLRIFSLSIIPFIITAILGGVLIANNRHTLKEASGILQNIIIIVVVLIFNEKYGIIGLVISFFMYISIDAIYLYVVSKRYFKFEKYDIVCSPFKSENIHALLKMIGPLVLSFTLLYLNELVNKIFVSRLDAGSVTALGYGASLSNLVTTLFAAFATIFFTKITVYISNSNFSKASNFMFISTSLLLTLAIPISITTYSSSIEIVKITFYRGLFDENSVVNTAAALKGYSLMFIPFVIKTMFSNIQYSRKKTVGPVLIGSFGVVINIILSAIFIDIYGIFGISLSTGIAEFFVATINIIITRKNNNFIKLTPYGKFIPFWIIGGVMVYLTNKFMLGYLGKQSVLISLVLTVFVSMIIYSLIVSPVIISVFKLTKAQKSQPSIGD